jgi:hypothetical protein
VELFLFAKRIGSIKPVLRRFDKSNLQQSKLNLELNGPAAVHKALPWALAESKAGSLRQSFCQAMSPANNEIPAQAR